MKQLLRLSAALLLTCIQGSLHAQIPFNIYDSINIGNINARMSVHGFLWNDPINGSPACEFPKGSGKHIAFNASLWIGGFQQSNLSLSATSGTGVDYWPGPIERQGSTYVPTSYANSQNWAKIWKITRADINTHLGNTTRTIANTPASVLEWPAFMNPYAKGNGGASIDVTNLAVDLAYAPFIDVNGNGAYDPLAGDYPDIKGDQAMWCLYNDYGPTHNATSASSLLTQIGCMAYAYHWNTIADNIVFYQYTFTHWAPLPIDSFTHGLYTDFDLGDPLDDYIGFDSSHNMVYVYNSDGHDGIGGANSYGDTIPAVGITILKWDWDDTCGLNMPSGSFMRFESNNNAVTGSPTSAVEYYNYMTGSWKNGQHLSAPYVDQATQTTYNDGTGPGATIPYAYDGKNYIGTPWTECNILNVPYDRLGVVASKPQQILPGRVQKFAFALLAAEPKYQNGCPQFTLQDLQALADTAKQLFCNPPIYTAVNDIAVQSGISIYPNPAASDITVSADIKSLENIALVNSLGQYMAVHPVYKGNSVSINITHLAPGVYYLISSDGRKSHASCFVKE